MFSKMKNILLHAIAYVQTLTAESKQRMTSRGQSKREKEE